MRQFILAITNGINPSNLYSSPQTLWIPLILFLLFSASICSAETETRKQYAKYCNSVVPESTLTGLTLNSYKLSLSNDYFTGGNSLFSLPTESDGDFNPRTYSFKAHEFSETHNSDVIKVAAELVIHGKPSAQAQSHIHHYYNLSRHISWHGFPYGVISFELDGFWSLSTGMVCMVGQSTGSNYRQQGISVPISAMMKFSFPNSPSIFNSLAAGTLQSLDEAPSPNYFDSIAFTGLVESNYEYTLISKANETCSRLEFNEESLSLANFSTCFFVNSYLSHKFRLQYGSGCDGGTCNPLGRMAESLPKSLFFNMLKCSDDGNLRFHVSFASSDSSLNFRNSLIAGKSLIGEGYWDHKKNRMCAVTCHTMKDNSPINVSVGDCTIGFCLWFPSVLSIKRRSTVVGRIWDTNKIDKGQASTVSFSLLESDVLKYPPNLKYVYTELDAAHKLCKMPSATNSTNTSYPVFLKDMSMRLSLRDPKGNRVRGYAEVVSIGKTYFNDVYRYSNDEKELNSTEMVSYKIYMFNHSKYTEISAEGIYNVKTGMLCLIGCRQAMNSKYTDSMDCNIHINLQLAPSKAGAGTHTSTGTIRSTRKETDPLYFEYTIAALPLIETRASVHVINHQFGSPLNMKVDTSVMLVLSLTISCMCFLAQLFHVTKHLIFVSSLTVTWFVILNLAAFIPLLQNFEYLFYENKSMLSEEHYEDFWLVVTRVVVGLLLIIVLSLQFCLLYAIWSKRRAAMERKEPQAITKDKIRFRMFLYLSGGLISFFFQYCTQTMGYNDFLISYVCLVLEGFLLPQLILNTFWNPREEAFTPIFYLGTTILQALPHFSSTYIVHQHAKQMRVFYGFLIPGQALVLALVLFLLRESESSLYRRRFKYSAAHAATQIEAI